MKFQDIHLADQSNWEQIISYYKNGQYQNAISLIQNTDLNFKVTNANTLNYLMNYIVQTENLSDPTFKQNTIPCQEDEPTNQTAGEVWFQIIT